MIIPNITSALLRKPSVSEGNETLPRSQAATTSTLSIGTILAKHNGDWDAVIGEVQGFLQKALAGFVPEGSTLNAKVVKSPHGLEFQIPNPVSGGFAQGELTQNGAFQVITHPDGSRAFMIDYGSSIFAADQKTQLFFNRDTFVHDGKNATCISNIIGAGSVAVPYRLGVTVADQKEIDPTQWKFQVTTKGMGSEPYKIPMTNGFYVPSGNASPELKNQAFVQSLSVVTYNPDNDTSTHYAGQSARKAMDNLGLDPQFGNQILRIAKGGELEK